MKRIFLALLLLVCAPVSSGFDFEGGSLSVPDGFLGPVQVDKGQAMFIGFRYPHGDSTGALLQLTIVRVSGPVPELSDQDLRRGERQYLAQFLQSVAEQRTDFHSEAPEFVRISGIPAARTRWTGSLNDVPMQGVMYCLIHEGRIYSIHAQDAASFKGRYLEQATRAIESMQMKTGSHADRGSSVSR